MESDSIDHMATPFDKYTVSINSLFKYVKYGVLSLNLAIMSTAPPIILSIKKLEDFGKGL